MPYLEGPEKLFNTDFDDLVNIANNGLTTFESVGGRLHIAGDDGADCRISIQPPNLAIGGLINWNGQVEVITGSVALRLSNGNPVADHFVSVGKMNGGFDTTRRRTVDSGATFVIEVLEDGTEAYFDNFSLTDILQGGVLVPAAVTFAWIDFDGDTRQFTLPIVDANAATHDARQTEVTALEDALEAVSHLALTRTDFIIERTDTGAGKPAEQAAQVNIEWKITYVDDVTGDVETVRVGGADLTLAGVLLPGSNVADLTQAQMAALVTAFEALVLSSAGNAVSVQQIAFLE